MLYMDIAQIRAITLFAAGFLNCIFALLIWLKVKSKEAYHLGWLAFFSSLNAFSWWAVFFFDTNKLFWVRTTWVAVFLVSANLIFTFCFTGKKSFFKLKLIFWYGLAAVIFVISIATPFIIPVISSKYPFIISQSFGSLNQIARIFVIIVMLVGLYYLFNFYRQSQGYKKLQLKYFITGTLIYLIGSLIFGGFLPLFSKNLYIFLDIPVYFSVIWLGLAAYAIIKKELFDIKIILTELLVSLICLILFVQIFLMENLQAKIIELVIFVLFCLIAYLLVKATYREIAKEKEMEKLAQEVSNLNKNLEKKVKEKTNQLQISVDELAGEKNKILAIIANFTDPIIVLDKDNKISVINPAARNIFELIEQDLGRLVAMENRFSMANFTPIINRKFNINKIKGETDSQEFIQEEISLTKNGQEIIFKVITAKILSLQGERLGTMKIFYNLTREKMIDRLKSEFISIAAHQLRTPLSAMKWILSMMVNGDTGKLNPEQQELLNKGYEDNERIIKLVDNLLDVSQIEEGKFGFDFKKIDFEEVLNVAMSNAEELVVKNKQQIIINKPGNLAKVDMDKERMIMVMQNLLVNAIKYSPPNSKIEVEILTDKKNLEVKIKDQGVGIPQEDQAKIFSKFFRASNAIKMETEGNGLGLFIVKNIIDKHNGKIKFTSEEGKGTEVSFSIPLEHN